MFLSLPGLLVISLSSFGLVMVGLLTSGVLIMCLLFRLYRVPLLVTTTDRGESASFVTVAGLQPFDVFIRTASPAPLSKYSFCDFCWARSWDLASVGIFAFSNWVVVGSFVFSLLLRNNWAGEYFSPVIGVFLFSNKAMYGICTIFMSFL